MKKWLVTFFGAGLMPKAPGTAGSALACVALFGLSRVCPGDYWTSAVVAGLLASCALAIGLAPWAIAYFGRKDPQPFVLDEVAGICLTALFLPIGRWWHWGIVFAAFRVFDILKPPPARQLEKLPAGWGILCDDLAAAVYANLVCQVVFRYFISL